MNSTNPSSQAARSAATGGAASVDAAHDSLSDEMKRLRADFVSLKDSLARLVSQAGSAASGIADAGSELAASAKAHAKTFTSELEGMARRNPLGTMAGVLVIGVIIGMMSRGRG